MSLNNQNIPQSKRVTGRPSKELFITMLTRDIPLADAISDLVDNCVDGALRSKGKRGLKGLEVKITLTDSIFIIKDNCGGIDKELAQNYAFRFGRPLKGSPQIDYSVGQFGIGMKRALFKIGKKFGIKSISKNTSFFIEIDVKEWSKYENDWDFKFKKLTEKKSPIRECGTEIVVSALNLDVKERFRQKNFLSELKEKLELQHLMNLSGGLSIKINNYSIKSTKLQLCDGKKFTTAYWEKKFPMYGNTHVKIYAGIGTPELNKGGWYIFCNNRLIEGPEQTAVTGWGDKSTVQIPKYHSQFNRFRGFVFFESKLSVYLPWNTSKTSVDIDSPIFQNVKLEMLILMRPIIDFLNKVHVESGAYQNKKLKEKYIQDEIDSVMLRDYLKVKTSSEFNAPSQKKLIKKTNEVIISYARSKTKIEKLQKIFHVSSPRKVGEKTFDYTYERECKE